MSNGPTSQPISGETAMIPVASSSGAALCLLSGARLCVLIGCLFHLKEARYRGRIGPPAKPVSGESAMLPVASSSGAPLCLVSGARLCVLIGCLFQLKEARNRGRIGEREVLGRPIPADAVRAIDPVVQVSEAG